MHDALLFNLRIASQTSTILDRLDLTPREYFLATVHRAENTDRPENLHGILGALVALAESGKSVVVPLHPRTRKLLNGVQTELPARLMLIEPVPYLDMLMLEKHALTILTDSGGVQKEAQWANVPCVTLREETEWVETVASGWNILAGATTQGILEAIARSREPQQPPPTDWTAPGAAGRISRLIVKGVAFG